MDSFIDKTIKELNDFCVYLETQINTGTDEDKIILLRSIQNLACYLINIFAKTFPNNAETFSLVYKTTDKKNISTKLKGFYILRTSKRIFISETWSYIENFFQKKINDDTKIGKTLLIQYYKNDKDIPAAIDFLRETRNCSHNNGKYGSWKKGIEYEKNNERYKLEPGESIKFAGFSEIISLIKESLKLI